MSVVAFMMKRLYTWSIFLRDNRDAKEGMGGGGQEISGLDSSRGEEWSSIIFICIILVGIYSWMNKGKILPRL